MDNKTWLKNKKKELDILENFLYMFKFSKKQKYNEKIKAIEKAIKEINEELYNNTLQDV